MSSSRGFQIKRNLFNFTPAAESSKLPTNRRFDLMQGRLSLCDPLHPLQSGVALGYNYLRRQPVLKYFTRK